MKRGDPAAAAAAQKILTASSEALAAAAGAVAAVTADAATLILEALRAGGKVLLCGNGGSAADAQHIAAELAGRLRKERPGLAAIALTVNPSVLTAVANDYGYDAVFARQVEAIGRPGDVLVGISTSGRSGSVLRALAAARAAGLSTIGLTGEDGGAMTERCDVAILVPSSDTQRIQEAHIAVGHAICELVESELFAD
ncbi:MAG: D-sedoheptulose 7-phosphate isomerase [Candidatus Eisenbacteria bacterium]|nr:D-sedoheptulose 7-phosphate isomerase [Candidatus Eisenbacteria bacterium]